MSSLVLTSLEKALASLEEILTYPKNPIVRDSAIQRFEYTFELSFKFLKRFLKMTTASAQAIEQYDYKEVIREGARLGFIREPEAWFAYREARNETSHTYDAAKAEQIYACLAQFAQDARFLFSKLEAQNQKL